METTTTGTTGAARRRATRTPSRRGRAGLALAAAALLVGCGSAGTAEVAASEPSPTAAAATTPTAAASDDLAPRAATVVIGDDTYEFPGPGFCEMGGEDSATVTPENPAGRAVNARFTTDDGDELNFSITQGIKIALVLVVDGVEWDGFGRPLVEFTDDTVTYTTPMTRAGYDIEAEEAPPTVPGTITIPCS